MVSMAAAEVMSTSDISQAVPRTPLVSLKNVGKAFVHRDESGAAMETIVFQNLSLDLLEHEFLCVVGPSGCGKSTLANLIAGLERPSSGKVVSGGAVVQGPGRERGLVFQSTDTLYDWLTVKENIILPHRVRGEGKQDREKIAARYLQLVGLESAAGKYPRQLSGGMRQRAQLARVLANDPQILLMDEPFGALDSQTRRSMQRELADIWIQNKKTVLFITHDIDEAIVLADRIAVMSAGPHAVISEIIENPLPRPRSRNAEFLDLWTKIDTMLGHGRH
jgi:NitT/TauT family transport system ATP-binding protein